MNTHSDKQAAALLAKAKEHYPEMLLRIQTYGASIIRLRESSDLLDVMRRTADVILAAKAIANMGDDVDKQLRIRLAEAIAESGATGVETTHHIVETRKATREAMITDVELIPPEFMDQPKPKPDRAKIRAALERGAAVPGATLANGGSDVLVIRGKKGVA